MLIRGSKTEDAFWCSPSLFSSHVLHGKKMRASTFLDDTIFVIQWYLYEFYFMGFFLLYASLGKLHIFVVRVWPFRTKELAFSFPKKRCDASQSAFFKMWRECYDTIGSFVFENSSSFFHSCSLRAQGISRNNTQSFLAVASQIKSKCFPATFKRALY